MGMLVEKRLHEIREKYEMVGDVRGKGLIFGIEIVKDKKTKTPAQNETAKVCYRTWELGMIIYYLGLYSNSIEIAPPLTITEAELEKGLDLLEQAVRDVETGKVSDEKVDAFRGWAR